MFGMEDMLTRREDIDLDSKIVPGTAVVDIRDGRTGVVRALAESDPRRAGEGYIVDLDGGGAYRADGQMLHVLVPGLLRFAEVPRLSPAGSYEVTTHFGQLEKTIAGYTADYGLQLNPDFQRGHVWSEAQQVAYVEFLARGGRSARVLYFNCPSFAGGDVEDRPMVLMDGLQRLTALRRFGANEIAIFGQRYQEWSATDRRRFAIASEFSLRFNVNELQTRAAVLRWYLDANTGGVVHAGTEIERVRGLLAAEEQATKS